MASKPPLAVVPIADAPTSNGGTDPLVFSEGLIGIDGCKREFDWSARFTYRVLAEPGTGIITVKVRGRRQLCRRSVRLYLHRKIKAMS